MNDFDDNFGGPAQGDYVDPYAFGMDPMVFFVLVAVGFILVVLCGLAYVVGRRHGLKRLEAQRKVSREAIFDSVRYALDKALKSSGAVILERGREVSDLLESRVGLVTALNGKLGKAVKALDEALTAEKPAVPVAPGAPKVKVARSTEEHYHQVWKALQALNRFWQKDKVLPLIAAAQTELATMPVKVPVPRTPLWGPAKTAHAATATKAADPEPAKADDTVKPTPADTQPVDTPPPTPAPPAPPPKRKGKLPAHKRNMLA